MKEILVFVHDVTKLRYKEEIEDSFNKGWYLFSDEVIERGFDANQQPAIFVKFTLLRDEVSAAKSK